MGKKEQIRENSLDMKLPLNRFRSKYVVTMRGQWSSNKIKEHYQKMLENKGEDRDCIRYRDYPQQGNGI